MSFYGSLVTEGLLDKFQNKSAKAILDWNKKAVPLERNTRKAISKNHGIDNIKRNIDFSAINKLIKIYDSNIDNWKSDLGKYFNNYAKYLNSYKFFVDTNKKYNTEQFKGGFIPNSRNDYSVDLNSISVDKAREILCKDIKKACSNCNKNPDVKKELLKGLEKLRNKYPGIENEDDYKEIEKAIKNNTLFKFEDGGDYFYVCGVATQDFILSCYPQYMVGEELEKISSFQIDDIHYGDGDEGCLYISPYTD